MIDKKGFGIINEENNLIMKGTIDLLQIWLVKCKSD